MSEFHVEVFRIGNVEKHPNADSLSLTSANGYPVIFRNGDYKEGDLAVYVPVDAIVPKDDPRWAFLDGHWRIRAKRLRSIFSMGMLTQAEEGWQEGQDVQAELRIEKWEPAEQFEGGSGGPNREKQPADTSVMPVYDIEGLRKYSGLLIEQEEVWITEKIHGCNARFAFDGTDFHTGSRTRMPKSEESVWRKVAAKYNLQEKLSLYPNVAIYGEIYGSIQDLKYGVQPGEHDRLVCFDALDLKTMRWFDVDDFLYLTEKLDLPVVPTLYRGPWSDHLRHLAEGKTTMPGADHVREGFVVKPVKDRTEHRFGRVFLKYVGEGYLLRKGG